MTPRELDHLRKVYLASEVAIINEIARLRQRGLIDYHAVAALDRVQKILLSMQDETWKYVPRLLERYFYVNHPEKYTRAPKTILGHLRGYENAIMLTAAEQDTVARLTHALIGDMERSSAMIMGDLSDMLLGREMGDIFRKEGLEAAMKVKATGSALHVQEEFIERLRVQGVTAFVDKAGRRWSLHAYTDMVLRTTTRQAGTLAMLERDPEHDLYKLTSHGTTCPICAPLEGRVFSKSGRDPVFPPLASAFSKIDKNGPDTLDNTYLNIHPNCLHVLVPWSREAHTKEEVEAAEKFSSYKTNPRDRDPRSEAQIADYKRVQEGRAKMLEDFKEFENFRIAIPDKVPKTFQTYQKHKLADDAKYKSWVEAYKERVR